MNPARSRRRRPLAALAVGALLLSSCSSDDDTGGSAATTSPSSAPSATAPGSGCPTEVDAEEFASADELRELLVEFNEFGLRSPGSDQHEASIDWLAERFREIDGVEVDFDEFTIARWQPTPEAPGDVPGRDLASAGSLVVEDGGGRSEIDTAAPVAFSLPTGDQPARGELVFLPADQITEESAAGKIVVTEIPHTSLPYAAFGAIGHHITDDLPTEGDYDRPYLRDLPGILDAAGVARAAGLVMVWDAPTEQMEGYWDPHSGTRYHVPAVYVGNTDLDRLRQLAEAGATAEIEVLAEWDEAPTRNLIATIPGQTRERIVINANSDSVSWVQENATVAAVALARYFASLPLDCRERDIEIALTSNHLAYRADGLVRYVPEIDEAYDEGTVAFVMAMEHLGTMEILPSAPGGPLELTGEHDTFAWSAPKESPVLVEASVAAVKRRELGRTAVLQGVGVPDPDQLPEICSQGGLGTVFHSSLVPTIAGISGPWSLWAPMFGEDALDYEHMRAQAMTFGDIAVALDDVPREEIAGEYLDAREQRAAGGRTCPDELPPEVAPLPGG